MTELGLQEGASSLGARGKRGEHTPVMQQYFRAKAKCPDALVFFRLGDFYEMFFDDAVLASRVLDLTLTSRGKNAQGQTIPMAGVPHHSAAGYISRLLERGHKVAICEQLGDPSKIKGIVPRDVVRVVTPGIVFDPEALDAGADNYVVAVSNESTHWAFAALELTRSELQAGTTDHPIALLAQLTRLDPREVIWCSADKAALELARQTFPLVAFRESSSTKVHTLTENISSALRKTEGWHPHGWQGPGLSAISAVLSYAQECEPSIELEVQRFTTFHATDHMLLDDAAVRNLELVRTTAGDKKESLLHLLDQTVTPMGARLLKRRLLAPLLSLGALNERHDVVGFFLERASLRIAARETLTALGDLERLATRFVMKVATPRDVSSLRDALQKTQSFVQALQADSVQMPKTQRMGLETLDACGDVKEKLEEALLDEGFAPNQTTGIFRESFAARIAELRNLTSHGKDVLLALEERERNRTQIPSLKIRFTRVFGYYIEVSKSYLRSVPQDYRRKQTIAGGERFITEELEHLQDKILSAEEQLRALEQELFQKLVEQVGQEAHRIRTLALVLADIDVSMGLAEVAHRYGYVRPHMLQEPALKLVDSRHPVVEHMLPAGTFVANDVTLDAKDQRLLILTGPNMAGKSTAMRQVGLSVIMAQMGSFVPAKEAHIGLADRVYTRVGANDHLSLGQSTFMVEMLETASILQGATERSLVLVDEIGRGTSTYDGLAIAWAVAEFLHNHCRSRTMFATHYHEVAALAEQHAGAFNCNVAAKEVGHEIVFLHRLMPGAANRSYGVAVARLAGLPASVIARATELLKTLEAKNLIRETPVLSSVDVAPVQDQAWLEIQRRLKSCNLDQTTPLQALQLLTDFKTLV